MPALTWTERRVSRRAPSAPLNALNEVIKTLRKYGGSLYIADPGYCWVNSDATSQCVADSPVGYAQDLCRNYPATQSTSAAKPMLRYVNGKWSWEFDGAKNTLSTAIQSADTEGRTLIAAGSPAAAVTAGYMSMASSRLNGGVALYKEPTGVMSTLGADGAWRKVTVGGYVTNEAVIHSAIRDYKAGTLEGRKNTIAAPKLTGLAMDGNIAKPIHIGCVEGNSFFWGGRIFAVATAPTALTNADLLIIERYFSQLSGVILP